MICISEPEEYHEFLCAVQEKKGKKEIVLLLTPFLCLNEIPFVQGKMAVSCTACYRCALVDRRRQVHDTRPPSH